MCETQELITEFLAEEISDSTRFTAKKESSAIKRASINGSSIRLDGTVNYFYGIPHFCISIALRLKGEIIVGVIYDPMRDEIWTARKRRAPTLNGKPFRVSERDESGGGGRLGRPFQDRRDHRRRPAALCRTWSIARANAV